MNGVEFKAAEQHEADEEALAYMGNGGIVLLCPDGAEAGPMLPSAALTDVAAVSRSCVKEEIEYLFHQGAGSRPTP